MPEMLRERISPKIIESLIRLYSNAREAIFELVDNAVDDRVPGNVTRVQINLPRGGLTIQNTGGAGMGLKDLDAFLEWGRSEKRGKIGRYGLGGKAALGYLGTEWELMSKKPGESTFLRIHEPRARERPELHTYSPNEINAESRETSVGSVTIKISGVSKKIDKITLVEELGDVYGALITQGELEIVVDGEPVKPIVFKLEEMKNFKEESPNAGTIRGWIGLLGDEPRKRDKRIKGGVRCLLFGRKIMDGEYFGHKTPTFKASLGLLAGEVFLDNVPVSTHKVGFDRSAIEWEEAQAIIHREMEPFVQELLHRKDTEQPTQKEIEDVKEAGKDWEEFEKWRNRHEIATGKGLTTETGTALGQKEPEPTGQLPNTKIPESTRGSYKPATPPPLGAIGKRLRKGTAGMDYDIRPLGDPRKRSEIAKEGGGKVFIFNSEFPEYKERKEDRWYKYATMSLEHNKPEEGEVMDVSSYLEAVNSGLYDLYHFLVEHRSTQKPKKQV